MHSKKNENRILNELRERVFQKDKTIKKRHDEIELENATKEALSEMTELPLKEINKLEEDIRKEFKKTQIRNRNLRRIFISLFLLTCPFIYYFLGPYQFNNKLVFEENFDNNKNNWSIFDDFSFNRYFENGSYVFTGNRTDSCYDDALILKIPKRFTAEITSTWKRGQFDAYGSKFILTYDRSSYFFKLHPPNKTDYKRSYSHARDKWKTHSIKPNAQEHSHTQKLTIKPRPWPGDPYVREAEMTYSVNDEIITETVYDELKLVRDPRPADPELFLTVCGCQTVTFDHIKITDDQTGKIIIDAPFSELKDRLHPEMKYKKYSYIEDGQYIFKTIYGDYCYNVIVDANIKKHSQVKLTSTWLEGDNYYYGLIIEKDKDNFYAFEIKADGKACFILKTEGENEIFIDNLDSGIKSDGKTSVEQMVFFKGNKLEYYINDKLILEQEHSLKDIKKAGLRVCGKQNVAFDKLEIWE